MSSACHVHHQVQEMQFFQCVWHGSLTADAYKREMRADLACKHATTAMLDS
jgi:hypothetical protein